MSRSGSTLRDPRESRKRLDRVIATRQAYADYLRAVANGQRVDDHELRHQLKARCEEALHDWNSLLELWRRPRPAPESAPDATAAH